jgi:hypothetical protein
MGTAIWQLLKKKKGKPNELHILTLLIYINIKNNIKTINILLLI